jgi:ankyrin repeat protein
MGYRKQLQINAQNREGDTPLHLSCEDGYIITSIFLVNNGADLWRTNREGKTPLDLTKDVHFKEKLMEAARSYGS